MERLGFELGGPHCPFVAAIDGGSAAAHAGPAARPRSAGALTCTQGRRVAGLTGPGFDWAGYLAVSALILAAESATGAAGLARGSGRQPARPGHPGGPGRAEPDTGDGSALTTS
ncbi:hypothetical protein ACFVTC_18870 [Streptomyces sp. NPDC057950]|uniref:hypothetical protein n=1 Tax=Streptomyces sp. NPDC057950 TaxID=3346288 RepID=UPI0036E02551